MKTTSLLKKKQKNLDVLTKLSNFNLNDMKRILKNEMNLVLQS